MTSSFSLILFKCRKTILILAKWYSKNRAFLLKRVWIDQKDRYFQFLYKKSNFFFLGLEEPQVKSAASESEPQTAKKEAKKKSSEVDDEFSKILKDMDSINGSVFGLFGVKSEWSIWSIHGQRGVSQATHVPKLKFNLLVVLLIHLPVRFW